MLSLKNIENIKALKYLSFYSTLIVSVIYGKCSHKRKRIFKEESIEILRIFGLIKNV